MLTQVGQGIEQSHVRAADFLIAHLSKERHLRDEHAVEEDLMDAVDGHGRRVEIPRKGLIQILE